MLGISLEKAPRKGCLLAYFRNALIFEPYIIENGRLLFEGSEAWQHEIPKECHLFDAEQEYRMICREARNDRVEIVLTMQEEQAMDPDLLYEEDAVVKEEYARRNDMPQKLKIINRYRFTENDTLVLSNYRLALQRGVL